MLNVNKTFFSIYLFSLMVSANAEPTKKETADFIVEKTNFHLNSHRCKTYKSYDVVSAFSNNHCTFTQKEIHYKDHKCSSDIYAKNKKIFDLKYLDPERLETHNGLVINTRAGDEKILEIDDYHDQDKISKRWRNITNILIYKERVNLPKVKRAFEHLIKLCGGKGELF